MLTLDDSATDESRRAIASALRSLVGQIPGLLSARTATDLGASDPTADLIFIMEFDSEASWQAYRAHDAHVAVIRDHIASVLASKTFLQAGAWEVTSAP